MSETKKKEPDFTCPACGREHRFTAYVHAHFNERLTHTCECGQRQSVFRGTVTPVKNKTTRAKVAQ